MGDQEELLKAALEGNVEKVEELLSKGVDPNVKDEDGNTPLHLAIKANHLQIAKLLIEKGADVNARDRYGWTPLHIAAGHGNLEVVQLLVEKGADVNAKDAQGRTPLHVAPVADVGHADVVEFLVGKSVDVNARDRYGRTPLHYAAAAGRAEVAKLLLERGADVNAKEDKYGDTPLHAAAAFGYAEVARLLLEHGADPSIGDNDSVTPLDVAREEGHEEVARVIEEFMKRRRGGRVKKPVATSTRASAREPVPAAPSILGVECSSLRVGEWGRLLVRVRGSGTAALSLEGDVDWLDPGRVKLSGDAVVEVPVRPRAAGEVPVRVVVRSPGGEDAKITWLKVVDRAGKCPSCGAPAEPGAKYCWKCGAKLVL